jgi:hypothetical protein
MKIHKKLAAFQQECPTIHKGTSGYGYSYADLPTIFDKINPLLKKHGLGFTQLVQDQGIETILFTTDSDETISSITPIPENVQLKGMNDFQVLGSAITYIRRYALSSMLGIVTDKDTDASGKPIKKDKPVASGKKWLNKGTTEFNQAKKFIAEGGSMAKIKAKYQLSKETESHSYP